MTRDEIKQKILEFLCVVFFFFVYGFSGVSSEIVSIKGICNFNGAATAIASSCVIVYRLVAFICGVAHSLFPRLSRSFDTTENKKNIEFALAGQTENEIACVQLHTKCKANFPSAMNLTIATTTF